MRKVFYLFAATALFAALIVSCNKSKEKVGIAFTFDDSSIDEWYAQRSLFQKYNIHATFFVTRPHLMDSNLVNKLKILESDGHEIACHAYEHKHATDYELTEDYINQQIKPALQKFQELGFNITSFAYPYGASTPALDSALLQYFKVIRKATHNTQDTTINQYPEIYANANAYRIVNAMGMDRYYGISFENFETGIKRAVKNKEILIVYAHITDTSNWDFAIHPEYLEKLFLICKKHHVKSMTMSEMYHYFQKESNT